MGSIFQLDSPHFDPAAVGVCQLLLGLLASPEQTDTGGLRLLCAPCLKPGFLAAKSFAILKFRFGRISLKIKAKLSFLSLQIFEVLPVGSNGGINIIIVFRNKSVYF